MKNLHFYPLWLLILALSACAPWSAVDPNNRNVSVKEDYTLEAPLGWVRKNYDVNDVFFSRDGPLLNFIAIDREKHERELARTKRTTKPDLLPQEVAELVIAEQKAPARKGPSASFPTAPPSSAASPPCASIPAGKPNEAC